VSTDAETFLIFLAVFALGFPLTVGLDWLWTAATGPRR
jgi:hypothetical protein